MKKTRFLYSGILIAYFIRYSIINFVVLIGRKRGVSHMMSLKKYPFISNQSEFSMELTCKEVVDSLENIRYTTYGLRVLDEEGGILFAAEDVDTNKAFVERFIEFCAGSDINLIHVPDLLEDYMAER